MSKLWEEQLEKMAKTTLKENQKLKQQIQQAENKSCLMRELVNAVRINHDTPPLTIGMEYNGQKIHNMWRLAVYGQPQLTDQRIFVENENGDIIGTLWDCHSSEAIITLDSFTTDPVCRYKIGLTD